VQRYCAFLYGGREEWPRVSLSLLSLFRALLQRYKAPCTDKGNIFVKIGIFLRRDTALLQRYMAPLPRHRCSFADNSWQRVDLRSHGSDFDSAPCFKVAATHCKAMQLAATHCNTLQHTATHCNTLQHTATHCNTLQHTAIRCSTLQCTAIHCVSPQGEIGAIPHIFAGTYLKHFL